MQTMSYRNRWIVLAAAVLIWSPVVRADNAASGDNVAGTKVTMGEKARVFTGENNVKVTVAPYTQEDKAHALVYLENVDGAWNNKVVDCVILPNKSNYKAYMTKNKGTDWKVLSMNQYQGDGYGDTWEVFLPEHPTAITVNPDDSLSKDASTRSVMRLYNEQHSK